MRCETYLEKRLSQGAHELHYLKRYLRTLPHRNYYCRNSSSELDLSRFIYPVHIHENHNCERVFWIYLNSFRTPLKACLLLRWQVSCPATAGITIYGLKDRKVITAELQKKLYPTVDQPSRCFGLFKAQKKNVYYDP